MNDVLLTLGDAARGAWSALTAAWAALAAALDALSPWLTPVMAAINAACSAAGRAVYAVLDFGPAWLGLVVISAVAGGVMVLAFKYTSNQRAIRRVRDDIKANLLVLRLFKDDLGVALKAQGRLWWALLRLQGRLVAPLSVMLLPFILLMAQMHLRYQHRGLESGEQTLLRLEWDQPDSNAALPTLEVPEALDVEVGPIAGGGAVLWRLRAQSAGRYSLALQCGDHTLHKELVVGEQHTRISNLLPGAHWMTQLLYPAEGPVPAAAGVRQVEVEYPQRGSWFDGADWWALWFIVLSVGFGFVFKSALGVEM